MHEIDPDAFVADGFVRVAEAFPRDLAAECRAILWRDTGCDPDDRSTWTRPVIRLGGYGQPPFRAAANTPRLHAAYDALAGKARGRRRAVSGRSRSVSRATRRRATTAGTSTRASPATTRTTSWGTG